MDELASSSSQKMQYELQLLFTRGVRVLVKKTSMHRELLGLGTWILTITGSRILFSPPELAKV